MFINKILISFIKGGEKSLLKSIVFQLLISSIASITAMFMSFLVSKLIDENRLFNIDIAKNITVIIVLLILSKILSMVNIKIVTETGIKIKDNIRTKVIQKMFLLGPEYTSTTRTGFLASTFTTRVEWLMNYYTKYLPIVISAIFNSSIFIIFLIYVDFYMGIIALISVLMMLFIPMTFFKIMKKRGKQEWEEHARYYSEYLDGLQGVVALKAVNGDEKYIKKMRSYGEKYRKSIMSHLKITIIEGAFLEFFARVGIAITVAILGWRCATGYVEKDLLVISFFSIGATFSPMLTLINAWHLGFQGVSGSYSIENILKLKSKYFICNKFIPSEIGNRDMLEKYIEDSVEKNTDIINKKRDIAISFKNVSFRYEGENENAVEDINFELKTGKTIAFVGLSGSGKSTIAGLLAGFYRANKGEIYLDNIKLDNDSIEFFQDSVSAVWQDNHLFEGDIFDNIKIGKWNSSEEEVYNAGKKAMIHDMIMELPDGYKTEIQELGSKFSRGERQRIAIARAILKNSPIMIFDEATSSLDRENEIGIQNTISQIKKDKAIFIIAHRLSSILVADEICLMDKGRIICKGSHSELIKKSEKYRTLIGGAYEHK